MSLTKIIVNVDTGQTAKSKLDAAFNAIDDFVLNGVTLTGSQVLTNKTLTSPIITTPQFNDLSSNNKYLFVFNELSADREVRWPILGANDEVIFANVIQTLTNKTLTSPVINSPTGIVKGDVGLGNVDNTSDANKPVSTAQQTAIDGKQSINIKSTLICDVIDYPADVTVSDITFKNQIAHVTNVGASLCTLNGGGSTFPIGGIMYLVNDNASVGSITLTPGGGVTITGSTAVAKNTGCTLARIGVNLWARI